MNTIKLKKNVLPLVYSIEKYIKNSTVGKGVFVYPEQDAIDILIKKVKSQFNYDVSPRAIISIFDTYTKDKIIFKYRIVTDNIKAITEKYTTGETLLALSVEYDFPPLGLLNKILQYKNKLTKQELKNLTSDNPKITERDMREYENAKKYDKFYGGNHKLQAEESIKFEHVVQDMLTKYNVKFKTQDDLTKEQVELYGKAINTPDFLITDTNFYINNKNY